MPAVDDAKTKSAPKKVRFDRKWLYIAGSFVLLLLPSLFYRPATATLHAGGTSYTLEIAASQTAQEKGLGGRASMASDHGMLFVFDTVKPECFWMKDMRFSLDMIWLDANKRVVHVEQNVPPQSYPNQYCPVEPAKYVIELKAGEVKRAGIVPGMVLVL